VSHATMQTVAAVVGFAFGSCADASATEVALDDPVRLDRHTVDLGNLEPGVPPVASIGFVVDREVVVSARSVSCSCHRIDILLPASDGGMRRLSATGTTLPAGARGQISLEFVANPRVRGQRVELVRIDFGNFPTEILVRYHVMRKHPLPLGVRLPEALDLGTVSSRLPSRHLVPITLTSSSAAARVQLRVANASWRGVRLDQQVEGVSPHFRAALVLPAGLPSGPFRCVLLFLFPDDSRWPIPVVADVR
jgi:hypothetical protein